MNMQTEQNEPIIATREEDGRPTGTQGGEEIANGCGIVERNLDPVFVIENFAVRTTRLTVCSSSPYEVVRVCGIVDWFKRKLRKSRYGSFVLVGVLLSGVKGGDPPVL